MQAQDIIGQIVADLRLDHTSLSVGDCKRIIAGLEDGEALAALGVSDDDQEAVEEAHSAVQAALQDLEIAAVPGGPQQVWAGWVWVGDDGCEHSWSKAPTREGCETKMVQAIRLHGVEGAIAR